MSTALSLKNIHFRYQQDWILEQFSADIAFGECCLITGDNGSGKTSLLKLIEGELNPQRGDIYRHETLKKSCAYLSQFHSFDLQIPVTLIEMLSMGLWKTAGAFKKINASAMQKIYQAIEMTGLKGLENQLVGELSGGQLQRARFARTWLQDEALILLDEPFTSVDKKTTEILWRLIQHWQQNGKTLLIVLHEHPVPDFIHTKTLVLHNTSLSVSYG